MLEQNDLDASPTLRCRILIRLEPLHTVADVRTQRASPSIDLKDAFSLLLSHQPQSPTTLSPNTATPDDMTEPPKPEAFRDRFLCHLEVLCKQTDTKLNTAWACYLHNFDRTSDARRYFTEDNTSLLKVPQCR